LFNSKVERLKKRLASLKRSDWDDPGDYPALEAIRIDGHGHLYVFPHVRTAGGGEVDTASGGDVDMASDGDDDMAGGGDDDERLVDERPVDIYSLDGERVFSGLISDLWDAAHGDFVYKLRLNDETEEHELVRYRLVESF